MKYNDKTAGFTLVIVRICYVLLAALVVLLPLSMSAEKGSLLFFDYISYYGKMLIVPFYLVVPAGYIALASLDKILSNLKKDIVFDQTTVRLLNRLTWCCVYAACIGLTAFIVIAVIFEVFWTMLMLAAGEAFMALVVRVVRNIFKKAIEIKEENDLTV